MNQSQPIFILSENTQRTVGKDAQRTNIAAAKVVAENINKDNSNIQEKIQTSFKKT